MNQPLNRIDHEVDRALRDGRFAAGEPDSESAARILTAASTAARRARSRRRLTLGLAALALGGTLVATSAWERAEKRAERRDRLVLEQQELQRELDDLKALLEERSHVRLGGDEKTEIYLDLARLDRALKSNDSNRSSG